MNKKMTRLARAGKWGGWGARGWLRIAPSVFGTAVGGDAIAGTSMPASASTPANPSAPKPPPIREKRARRVNGCALTAGPSPLDGRVARCRSIRSRTSFCSSVDKHKFIRCKEGLGVPFPAGWCVVRGLTAGFAWFRRLKIGKAEFDFALTWRSTVEKQVGLANPLTIILG